MILHSDKKVICVKDIPSNIIEEAIFILKENVIENAEAEFEERNKEIILNEAEDIVEEYIQKLNCDEEEYEIEEEPTNWKKEFIYIAFLLVTVAICISTVI